MSNMKSQIKSILVLIVGVLLGFILKSLLVSNQIERIDNEHAEQLEQLDYLHWKEVSDTSNYFKVLHQKVNLFYIFQSHYSNSYWKSKVMNTENHNLIKLADQLVDIIIELRQTNLNEIGWNDLNVVRDHDSGSISHLTFGSVSIVFSEELERIISEHSQLKKHIESL